MSDSLDLSIVVPAFNEEHFIVSFLNRIDSVVGHTGLKYEIIVVNDGSIDDTQVKADVYADKNGHVKIISYDRNRGERIRCKNRFYEGCG